DLVAQRVRDPAHVVPIQHDHRLGSVQLAELHNLAHHPSSGAGSPLSAAPAGRAAASSLAGSAGGRYASTGTRAPRITLSATLPSASRAQPPRPRVASAFRSAPSSSAFA